MRCSYCGRTIWPWQAKGRWVSVFGTVDRFHTACWLARRLSR